MLSVFLQSTKGSEIPQFACLTWKFWQKTSQCLLEGGPQWEECMGSIEWICQVHCGYSNSWHSRYDSLGLLLLLCPDHIGWAATECLKLCLEDAGTFTSLLTAILFSCKIRRGIRIHDTIMIWSCDTWYIQECTVMQCLQLSTLDLANSYTNLTTQRTEQWRAIEYCCGADYQTQHDKAIYHKVL